MPHDVLASSLVLQPGILADAFADGLRLLSERHLRDALRRRDPSAWSTDEAVQAAIANRLGWLTAPDAMAGKLDEVTRFAETIRREGVRNVVLLGMGGSSLAPEVMRAVIGVQHGWPGFTMIDSVNPDHLRSIAVDPRETLFVLASKSGSTIEPNALAAHFRQRLLDANVVDWARHFIAITDPGSPLEGRAAEEGFRRIFRNPPDIGGRYSALSLFGLVPAALMGIDGERLLSSARRMLALALDREDDPAIRLGALIGVAARAGHDKLTLLLPPELEAFGLWVEQLIAESTGKKGTGVVPIAGEPLGPPAEYGSDRLIVRVRLRGRADGQVDALMAAMEQAGVPTATIAVDAPASALGAEFMRWELATAAAAIVLGVNPFDEPNVQQAKDATRTLLDAVAREGRLPAPEPDAELDYAAFTLTTAARKTLGAKSADRFLDLLQPGDYCSVMAYLPESLEIAAVVSRFRAAVRRRTRCATMFGYGPRYLHSTGQLHKGGANNGVFLIVTAPGLDLPVPGETFSFGVLELAQALGDMASLDELGRRALHVHLPRPDASALDRCLSRLVQPE
ncbi:MAG TPA: hypothetical protein VNK41_00925 [Vicinamibacterales bacterium]|nr:hypothetical protein [Vicinamibacterales bacterium]